MGSISSLKALFIVLVMSSSLLCSAKGTVHYHNFILKETKFTRLCSTKSILTVNDSIPGPVLRIRKGDTVFVNVHNHGKYGITVHWHGVKQPRNPWSDGPENVTQCPIPPGKNFTQEIIFSREEGTLWWHAHSDWSRATVYGAIIVLPPKGSNYPYPRPHAEEIIVLGSWYKEDVMKVITDALATGADVNNSDAYTINGQPGDLYHCSSATTYRMTVDYGKTYLLRIINALMNEEMFFGIAKHKLTVVGMDGAYVKPITTNYIKIIPGQTMDVLVKAKHCSSSYYNYYIAARPFVDSTAVFDNSTTTAIFQYNNKAPYNNTPKFSTIPFPVLPDYRDTQASNEFTNRLRSLASKDYPVNVPINITQRFFITVSVNLNSCPNASCGGPYGTRILSSLNNISFVEPPIDILQAYYRNLTGIYTNDFPTRPPHSFDFTGHVGNDTWYTSVGTKVWMISYGEGVEIVFQGTNVGFPESHPFHLHGFNFYAVGIGSGNFNERSDPRSYNLVDPPEANTFGIPKNGWLAIRFVADNPGVWFMHCHLERHSSWGMDMVLIVKDGGTHDTSMRPPPSNLPNFCGS